MSDYICPAFDDLATAEAYVQLHPGAFLLVTKHAEHCPRAVSDSAACRCKPWFVPTFPAPPASPGLDVPGRPARFPRGRR